MAIVSLKNASPVMLMAAAAMLGGCSADSKKSGHLAKANQFFQAGDYEKAEIEYKNVLQIDQRHGLSVARLGIIYFDQGRLSSPLAYLVAAHRFDPKDPEVRIRLAKSYMVANKIEDARTILNELLAQNPQHAEALTLLAETAPRLKDVAQVRERLRQLPNNSAPALTALALLDLTERKFAEAEATLVRAREIDPKSDLVHAALGFTYSLQKNTAAAEASFVKAAELAGPRSPRKIQLAQFYVGSGQVPAAKRVLEELLKTAPDTIPARVLLADIAVKERRLDDCIALLDRALVLDPTHPEAVVLASQVHLAKGDPNKAVALLEPASKVFAGNAILKHQLGLCYMAQGENAKAAASFAEASSFAPDFVPPILATANLNIRQREYATAITSLRQLLQKVENPEARLLLGDAYRFQRNFDEALANYRQLTTAFPQSARLHYLSGLVLAQQNRINDARAAFNKAAELAPDDIDTLDQLVNLDVAQKDLAAAKSRVEAQIAKRPNVARLHFLLARIHASQNNAGGAESALKKAVELQPGFTEAYVALAELAGGNDAGKPAMAYLEAAIAKSPNDPRPYMAAGMLQERLKDYRSAKDYYEKALANSKGGDSDSLAIISNNLAVIYAEHLGEPDKALEVGQRARDLLPRVPEIADTLAWVLYKKKQPMRARPLAEEAAAGLPNNPDVQYHLGMIAYSLGDVAQAKTALSKAVQLSKSFAGVEGANETLAILAIDPAKAEAKDRAVLEKAVAQRKDDSVAQYLLGTIHERAGADDKALAAYDAALKANVGNVDASLAAIRLYRKKNDTAKALELANTARIAMPTDGRIAHAQGKLIYGKGEHARALGMLQEAARRLPNDPEVLYDFAIASYSVGRVAEAQSSIQDALRASNSFAKAADARKFLELAPLAEDPAAAKSASAKIEEALKADANYVPALMGKARTLEDRNDWTGAAALYQKALSQYPDFGPAHKRLAIVHTQPNGDVKKAVEHGTKARAAYPSDAEVAKALGIAVLREGNFQRALNLLNESARNLPSDAVLAYYIAGAHQGLKDVPASKRAYQRAIELGLSGDMAADAKRRLADAKQAVP
jgi:tetratricopeptide (TPR) repeat protein